MIQVSVHPTVCVRKSKDGLRRVIEIHVKTPEALDPLTAELTVNRRNHALRFKTPEGESRHQCEIDEPERPVELAVRPAGRTRFEPAEAAVAPHRPWEIYLLHHSHNDLGYTAMPGRVYSLHAEYIDQAVQFCRETDRYPKDARFRWNIECSWQLRNYILRRPASAIRALVELIRAGRIDLSAWYFNMTDVGNVEQTVRSLYFAHRFARQHRIALRSSMSCDVNGYPWCLPSVLADLGVDCHLSALNTTRSISPLDRPCAFHWTAPDGKKVLLWHGDHYHMGNYIGFADRPDHFIGRLSEYLQKLNHKGYPYPMALLQVSGEYTDNAPPNRGLSDFVRGWNRRYRSPRIRLTTMAEWFDRLKKEIDDTIPDLRQAWPDYWADGLASAPIETRLARRTRRLLADAETAHTALHLLQGEEHAFPLDSVYEEAAFANEHTWGYHASAREPFHPESLAHWNHKAGQFYRSYIAARAIDNEATAATVRLIPGRSGQTRIAVFNRLSWVRDGLVEVSVPLRQVSVSGFRIVDAETGGENPYQILGEQEGALRIAIRAHGVPALGYRVYSVVDEARPAADPNPVEWKGSTLEDETLAVTVERSGCIGSIRDKALDRELVDKKREYGLGQIVTESVVHNEGREALNGWWFHGHRNASPKNEIFRRGKSANGSILRRVEGPLFSEIEIAPKTPSLDRHLTTIRLVKGERGIRLLTRFRKPLNPDPHALYFAFPFQLGEPEVWLDAAGGPFRPGTDQIDGSCMDFYTIQDYVLLRNSEASVLWIPLDSPLVQVNEITTGDWIRVPPSPTSTLFAWAYNNYWTTNFPVIACGDFEFGFVIRVGEAGVGFAECRRAAAEEFSPLAAALVDPSGEGSISETSGSILSVGPGNVQATTLKPHRAGEGIVLRLEETAGKDTEAVVSFETLDVSGVRPLDLFEEHVKGRLSVRKKQCRVPLPAFGTRTIQIMTAGR